MHTVEKSYTREGILVTVLIHAFLLVLFYFMILHTPDPPLVPTMGGGGVELNYGDPNAGTGDMNNLLPIETVSQDELNKTEETPEPVTEETIPPDVTDETTSPTDNEEAVAINAKESNDKKNDAKKTEADTKKDQTKEANATPKYSFPGKTSNSSSSTAKGGEDKNTPGNPGNKDGKDEKGKYIMGTPGSGGGTGGGQGTGTGIGFGDGFGNWRFEGNPYPTDNSNEFGSVEFTLVVNEDGKVINVIEGKNFGISPRVVNIYKSHLLKLSVEAPAGYNIVPGMKVPVKYTINPKK